MLGHEKLSELLKMITDNRIDEFCEWFLREYYDKRYAAKFKNIISSVKNEDLDSTSEKIITIIKESNPDRSLI